MGTPYSIYTIKTIQHSQVASSRVYVEQAPAAIPVISGKSTKKPFLCHCYS